MSAFLSYLVSLFMVVALVMFSSSGAYCLCRLAILIPDFLLLPFWRRLNRDLYSKVSEQTAREKMIAMSNELDLWQLKHDLNTVIMYLRTMLTLVVIFISQQAFFDNSIIDAGLIDPMRWSLVQIILAFVVLVVFIRRTIDRSEEKSGYVFESRTQIEKLRLPITTAQVVEVSNEDGGWRWRDRIRTLLRRPRLGS